VQAVSIFVNKDSKSAMASWLAPSPTESKLTALPWMDLAMSSNSGFMPIVAKVGMMECVARFRAI